MEIPGYKRNTMAPRLFAVSILMLSVFWPCGQLRRGHPHAPVSGRRRRSLAYKVEVDGQPVFAYRYPTFNQFNWMDYASFSMTGKVHVTITSFISERDVKTCSSGRWLTTYSRRSRAIPVSFDLDRRVTW